MRKLSVISIIAILVVAMYVGSFKPVEAQGTEYSLYVNIVGHGVVTYNGSSPFDPGDVVVLTAYPESGWEFAGWSGDLSGTANPQYLTMDSNKSVTVTFTEIPEYSLYVNIVGHGVVTYNGSSPFDPGDVVVLTAYPESGWEFAGWSGDLSGTANPQYLTMDSNKSVTVTFTKIPQIPKWLWVIRWIWNLIRCWCWF